MQAIIVDNQWVIFEHIFPEMEDVIDKHFQAEHPHSRYIEGDGQSWDGIYRKYNRFKKQIRLPLLDSVVKLCDEYKFPIDVVDRRQPADKPDHSVVDADWLSGIKLEQYQIEAIKSTIDNDIGIISASTGSGKTEVAAGIIKLYNKPTVVIAEQRIVIEQLKERLELREIIDEVGLFYGGSTPSGQLVVVGSIQSLALPPPSLKTKKPEIYKKRLKRSRQFQQIVAKAELLIVDEVDRATAAGYRNLFRHYYHGRRKYGLSGTPFDEKKPVQNLNLRENIGDIIYEVSRHDVQKAGRIIPIKFIMIAYGENGNKRDKTAFDIAEREIMIDNDDFHQKVVKIVSKFPNDGTLILIDTCNITDLGEALEQKIPGSVFIYGKTSKTKRRETLDAFERRDIKCLIGGKILKRGLDLKGGADNLIMVGGGKLWSDFNQKVGRAVRINERGWARVFSFLFLNNFYLYKHSREHLKAVIDMGYKSQVVFSHTIVDGDKFVKSKFRIPK